MISRCEARTELVCAVELRPVRRSTATLHEEQHLNSIASRRVWGAAASTCTVTVEEPPLDKGRALKRSHQRPCDFLRAGRLLNRGHAVDRKGHGSGDEANFVYLIMQTFCQDQIRPLLDRDAGAQGCAFETTCP